MEPSTQIPLVASSTKEVVLVEVRTNLISRAGRRHLDSTMEVFAALLVFAHAPGEEEAAACPGLGLGVLSVYVAEKRALKGKRV